MISTVTQIEADCMRSDLTEERRHYCYLYAEGKWTDAILADASEDKAKWGAIARRLSTYCQTC